MENRIIKCKCGCNREFLEKDRWGHKREYGNPKIFKNLNYYQIQQQNRDKNRTIELKNKGYNILRIWESDIRNMDINTFLELLSNYVVLEEVLLTV